MRRAFTLIEIIVVLVLLAVLSGLIVARLTTARSRALLVEAERIGALFDAAARRATTRAEPVLVRYTPQNSGAGTSTGSGGAGGGGGGAASAGVGGNFAVMSRPTRVGRFTLEQEDWALDPLIAPVTLSSLRIQSVLRNDADTPFARGFSVTLNDPAIFGERTTIQLVPAAGANERGQVFEIRLSSDARRVRMISDPESLEANQLTPEGLLRVQTLDLDEAGLGEVAW